MKKYKAFIVCVVLAFCCITYIGGNYTFIFSPVGTLLPGTKGQEIRNMQQSLANWGYYDGVMDGSYGWATFQAVKDFQYQYGLKANGIADRETLLSMGMSVVGRGGDAYAQAKKGVSNEQLLARAINGEARGEPYKGQVAVGAVILNRTKDAKFPKTIAGVIYQPGAFTAVSDGQINVAIDPKSSVVKAARDALNGWDPTNGCLYYWNPATATSKWIWSRKIRIKIGKHNFGV